MGRRILAFFLGFLLGIIFVFGAVAAVLYYGAAVMHPSDIYPESDKFLGDLANMSLYDIYNSVTALYKEKVGVTNENGQYYTLGEFLEHYHIDPKALFGGKEVPADVLEVPIFEFIAAEDATRPMQQVKVSALFALVNMFTATEEGGGLFSQEALTKLAKHNMAELVNEELGMVYVFQDVTLCDVIPGIFPADTDTDNLLMWAMGQTSVGRLLAGFEGNILRQLNDGGTFEALGSLKMTQLLGENSAILSAIVKDYKVSDLIDDDGNLNPDGIMGGLFIGDLLGLKRNLLDEDAADDYSSVYVKDDVVVFGVGDGYVIRVTSLTGEYEYYEGRLFCSNDKNDHQHDADCFGYVWYNQETTATGIYAAIADVTVGDLMSGSSDALMDRFLELTLGDVLEGQEVTGAVSHLKDMTLRALIDGGIDNIYFGVIFEYSRKQLTELDGYRFVEGTSEQVMQKGNEFVRLDGNAWFEAELSCDEEHEHNAKCYHFVWYTNPSFENRGIGIKAALANTTIGELGSINSFIMDLTLTDVFGSTEIPSMLKSLSNVKIRDLSEAINDMYLGDFLEFHRECTLDHDHGDQANCNFVWYKCKPADGEHHRHTDDCLATGVMAKFADKKISQLSDLNDTIMSLTLYEVLGDSVPDMLKSIQHTKISELNDAINKMYIGDFLEFHRECTLDHDHGDQANCNFVWYKCKPADGEHHQHTDDCLATGVVGKLAGKKINELNDLNSTIMSLTLYDVMGDDVPSALKSIQDTPISQLEGAMQNMYLGQFLEYTRKTPDNSGEYQQYQLLESIKYLVEDGKTLYVRLDTMDGHWYTAVLDCSDGNHTESDHTATCFSYVWYTTTENGNEVVVTGVMGKLASIPLGEMSAGGLTRVINNTKLGEVIDGWQGNALLTELADVKIGELSKELNNMYVGSAMGYFRMEAGDGFAAVDGISGLYVKTGDNGTAYYAMYDSNKNKTFNAQLTCKDKTSEHTHDGSCYNFIWYECERTDEHPHGDECAKEVKGLNAKMSNLTLEELNGNQLGNMLKTLTMGDLIDSGMMEELTVENAYKLAIITCKNAEHKCTGDSSILGSTTIHLCSIKDYLTYVAEQSAKEESASAEEFWKHTHGDNVDGAYDEHLTEWRNMPLKEFISELLNAF